MEKIYLTHEAVQMECKKIAEKIIEDAWPENAPSIYGVPRGGIPVAYLVLAEIRRINKPGIFAKIVEKPEEATHFVDDIVDSGKTKERFLSTYGLANQFYAVIEEKKDAWYVFPWEMGLTSDSSALDIPLRLLQYIGEDPERDGLKDTPKRVVKAWDELFKGYKSNPAECLGRVFDNDEKYDEMVILRDVPMFSCCEHHILPFFGKVHVAYVPTEKIVGISKIARLIECFARRLQVQERLTQQIANSLDEALHPLGVAVMIEAQHMCMISRGIQKPGTLMVTTALRGVLKEQAARLEFLLLKGGTNA
jgi:GTP cyclohydrolase IA